MSSVAHLRETDGVTHLVLHRHEEELEIQSASNVDRMDPILLDMQCAR
jgi:hypothetical protein